MNAKRGRSLIRRRRDVASQGFEVDDLRGVGGPREGYESGDLDVCGDGFGW